MSDFVYFVPNSAGDIKPALEAAGCGHVFTASDTIHRRDCQNFQEAKCAGQFISRQGSCCKTSDKHFWQPVPNSKLWVGYDSSDPPEPTDLVRDEMISGYPVELDGITGQWIVPVARVYPTGTMLPETLTINASGELEKSVVRRYQSAVEMAGVLWQHAAAANGISDAEVDPMPLIEQFKCAAEILGLNYRVAPAELSVLGVLTTANIQKVLMLFVDMPGYAAATGKLADTDDEIKKKH